MNIKQLKKIEPKKKKDGNDTPLGNKMTKAASDLNTKNVHNGGEREISGARNLCWATLANLNLGSPCL